MKAGKVARKICFCGPHKHKILRVIDEREEIVMFRGTIHPSASFEEGRYIDELQKALKKKEVNKDIIIDFLVKINNAQRQMLRTPYKQVTGKDLEDVLAKELSGGLEMVILSLMHTPAKEDAMALHKAVKGLGTDEKTLIEILSTRTNEEIEFARNTFHTLYNRSLEEAVGADTSGDFKSLLVTLIHGKRDERQHVEPSQATQLAAEFAHGIDKKEKLDKIRILCTANYSQLRLLFKEYERLTGKSFDKYIEKEFSSDARTLLVALHNVALNTPAYFANQIHNAVKGFGAKDRNLIRILVSRSEIDMEDIKDEYLRLYSKSLLDTVHAECKGDYKNALVALVTGNRKQ